MQNEDKYNEDDLPQPTWKDHAYQIVVAAANEVPLGGVAASIVGVWVKQPLEKRRDEWFEQLLSRLQALEQHYASFSAENAFKNEAFLTAFLEATPIAIRTHQEEKREALLNGLSHAALPDSPEENRTLVYLDCIGSFTVWHFRVLEYCLGPAAYGRNRGVPEEVIGSLIDPSKVGALQSLALLYHVHPELREQESLLEMIVNDLASKGLGGGDWPQPPTVYPPNDKSDGGISFWTNNGGKEFLQFIESPLDVDPLSETGSPE